MGFVYLIREKRSYLHNPEYVGQVIRRNVTLSSRSTFDSYYFSKSLID
nr:MAG TPA: hypothetical protein [Bacteriophage sp.]